MFEFKEDSIIKDIDFTTKVGLNKTLESFEFNIIKKEDNYLEFDIKNCHTSVVNTLRRIILTEIPTIAFHLVTITENNTIFTDEYLAHRIGLIPIRKLSDEVEISNLKYNLKCFNDTNKNMNVYSNSIYGDDRIEIKRNVLIAKLAPGNSINMTIQLATGIGKDHAKWSPVSMCTFRLMPKIEIFKEFRDEDAIELQKLFSPGVIGIKNSIAYVENPRLEMMSREFLRYEKFSKHIKLSRENLWYTFTIETINEDPLILLNKSLEIFKEKANNLKERLNEELI
ncbi:RPAC1 [Hepatospora eriocheir]|uniref:RPAC1 n=1 Tax=Hepatospora eriocheir TaxID=1081669 RepID=A0A1X0QB93_9MICR|nr:RPAC1 [Hepatospora eriocheir]